MNLQQITDLDSVTQACRRADQLSKAITPAVVPQYKVLEAQKLAIETSMKALEEAVELGLCEDYWVGTNGVDTKAFYEDVEVRFQSLTEQDRINAAIAQGVAAAALPVAPDAADADMDI